MGRRFLAASGIYLITCCLFTLLICKPSTASAFRNVEEGSACPEFRLPDIAGKQIGLSDYKGKAVIVCFWSVEKDRSIEAMEILQGIYAKYESKGLMVIGVSVDRGEDSKVKQVVGEKKITFPVLLDSANEVYGSYGVFILPSMGLCDADGNLKSPISFSRQMAFEVEEKVEVLLGLKTAEEVEKELTPDRGPEKSTEEKSLARHISMAESLIGQKMYDKALAELETAAKTDANDPSLQIAMGNTLLLLDRPKDSKAAFEKALELNPMSKKAKEGLGEALTAVGEYDKALEILESVILLNPRPAPIHYRMGIIYEHKNDLKKAVEHYKKALELLLEE